MRLKIFVLIVSFLMISGCNNPIAESSVNLSYEEANIESGDSGEIIDINADEYLELIDRIFEESVKDNQYIYYSGYYTYNPYIQVSFIPYGKYEKEIIRQQAENTIDYILEELKKYKYEAGGIFDTGYSYINIYFHDYYYGKMSRNGGPFAQIKILEVENLKVSDVFWERKNNEGAFAEK
ncbi:MAG: hypothetical protein IKK24_05690 [Clostridia bacterium]|nr:hypothetical protein [Clostridia bacterium]